MSQTATLFQIVTGPRLGGNAVIQVAATQDETDMATALPDILQGHYITLQNEGSETIYYIWAPDDTATIDEDADVGTNPTQQCYSIPAGGEQSYVPPKDNHYLIAKTAANTSTLRVCISSEYRQ